VRSTTDEERALRKFVRRVVLDGRAQESDFAATITPNTGRAHDEWVREGLRRVTGMQGHTDLNRILFDDATSKLAEYDDQRSGEGEEEF